MAEAYLVKPDGDFLQRVLNEGGEDLKKCYQCATCSVVCDLSDGLKPFPRKEMIWTQWGLKDRLVADPDVWLCHQCNDCSTKCPRGARPGDVLAALRQETVQHFAVPQAFGRLVNQVKFLPLMLLIPVVLLVLALLLRDPLKNGPLSGILGLMDHPGFYAELFPHWLLIGFYTTFWGLAMLGAAVGVVRFWKAMKAADVAAGTYTPAVGIVPSITRVLTSVFSHGKFSKCQNQTSRRMAHLGAFYGFAALFVVSAWAVIALYMINPFISNHENHLPYPFPLLDFSWPGISGMPWKILANVGAIALIVGCLMAILDRLKEKEGGSASSSFDWIFVWLLLVVGITGFVTQVLRWIVAPDYHGGGLDGITPLEGTAYGVYFIHLVVVFHLLVYLPYSKFAHILYRTAALVYAEHSGRNGGSLEKT
jgi:quinone-modifying oxidoreductase subunit QmoC